MPVRANANVLVATEIKLHARNPFSKGLIFMSPRAPAMPAKIPLQTPEPSIDKEAFLAISNPPKALRKMLKTSWMIPNLTLTVHRLRGACCDSSVGRRLREEFAMLADFSIVFKLFVGLGSDILIVCIVSYFFSLSGSPLCTLAAFEGGDGCKSDGITAGSSSSFLSVSMNADFMDF